MSTRKINGVTLSEGVLFPKRAEHRIADAIKAADEMEDAPGLGAEETMYLAGWLDGVRWLVSEMSKVTLALAQHPLVQEIDRRLPDPEYVRAEDILASVVLPLGGGEEAEDAEPAATK